MAVSKKALKYKDFLLSVDFCPKSGRITNVAKGHFP